MYDWWLLWIVIANVHNWLHSIITMLRGSQTGEITNVSDWIWLGISTHVDLTKHRMIEETRNIIK